MRDSSIPKPKCGLTNKMISNVLKLHSIVSHIDLNGFIFAVESINDNGKCINEEVNVTNFTMHEIKLWLGY